MYVMALDIEALDARNLECPSAKVCETEKRTFSTFYETNWSCVAPTTAANSKEATQIRYQSFVIRLHKL